MILLNWTIGPSESVQSTQTGRGSPESQAEPFRITSYLVHSIGDMKD